MISKKIKLSTKLPTKVVVLPITCPVKTHSKEIDTIFKKCYVNFYCKTEDSYKVGNSIRFVIDGSLNALDLKKRFLTKEGKLSIETEQLFIQISDLAQNRVMQRYLFSITRDNKEKISLNNFFLDLEIMFQHYLVPLN